MIPKYLNCGVEVEFDCEVAKPIISDNILTGIEKFVAVADLTEVRDHFLRKKDDEKSPILTYKTEDTNRMYQIRENNENPLIDRALDSMLEGRLYGELEDFMPNFFRNFGVDPNSLDTQDNSQALYDSIWILGGIDKYGKDNNLSYKETLECIGLIEKNLIKPKLFGNFAHFYSFEKAKEIMLPEYFNNGFRVKNCETEYQISKNGEVCRSPKSEIVYLN